MAPARSVLDEHLHVDYPLPLPPSEQEINTVKARSMSPLDRLKACHPSTFSTLLFAILEGTLQLYAPLWVPVTLAWMSYSAWSTWTSFGPEDSVLIHGLSHILFGQWLSVSRLFVIWLTLHVVRDQLTYFGPLRRWRVNPGVYFERKYGYRSPEDMKNAASTSDVQQRISAVLRKLQSYTPPQWAWNGDACTFQPFVANAGQQPLKNTVRRWLKVKACDTEWDPELKMCNIRQHSWLTGGTNGVLDAEPGKHCGAAENDCMVDSDAEEAVALDFMLPENFDIDRDEWKFKQLIIIFHGLNGGSQEDYVVDLGRYATEMGVPAVCMTARGMSMTPLAALGLMNASRIGDAASSIMALKRMFPTTDLIGVGFSMGGIVLGNTVARMGERCPLKCATCLSGAPDCYGGLFDPRSQRLWQPFLVDQLKLSFISRSANLFDAGKANGSGFEMERLVRATTIPEFDQECQAPLGMHGVGPRGLCNYYRAGSCIDDLEKVAIPTLWIHAQDDPLIPSDSFHEMVRRIEWGRAGKTALVMTRAGGHVGFPTDFSQTRRWRYMCCAALEWADLFTEFLEKPPSCIPEAPVASANGPASSVQ